MIREMAWYDAYLERGGADRSANPTPGNKTGGLTNIVEKALGSAAKAGSSALAGVFGPGERVTTKGLIFAATPASDFVCGTLQLAAGMNMHVFTTGRGTPYGLAMAPVIKVASRSALADRWSDLIDINAGRIATGEATIQQVGEQIFHLILDVASGRKQTWADHWGLHNDLLCSTPPPSRRQGLSEIYTCAKPPSTNSSMPVTKLLSSEARKTAALAISSGRPSLPNGTVALMLFKRSCPTGEEPSSSRRPSVSIGPGLIAFTRMRRALRSVVQVRAKERIAALVAAYTLLDGIPLLPTTDAFRMIDPPSGINGNAFWTVKSMPFTLPSRCCRSALHRWCRAAHTWRCPRWQRQYPTCLSLS